MIIDIILDVTIIELIAGLGYFAGHILLSQKKAYGWIVKIVGGVFWIIFLFQNNNDIFAAVTIVVVAELFYGLYKWVTKNESSFTAVDDIFNALAVVTALGMICYLLVQGLYTHISALETIIVIAEISGTVLLARKKMLGWYSYIVMSACASVLVIFVNSDPAVLLGILEFSSIYFYIQGIRKLRT